MGYVLTVCEEIEAGTDEEYISIPIESQYNDEVHDSGYLHVYGLHEKSNQAKTIRKQKFMETFENYMSFVAKKLKVGQTYTAKDGRIWTRIRGGLEELK